MDYTAKVDKGGYIAWVDLNNKGDLNHFDYSTLRGKVVSLGLTAVALDAYVEELGRSIRCGTTG